MERKMINQPFWYNRSDGCTKARDGYIILLSGIIRAKVKLGKYSYIERYSFV